MAQNFDAYQPGPSSGSVHSHSHNYSSSAPVTAGLLEHLGSAQHHDGTQTTARQRGNANGSSLLPEDGQASSLGGHQGQDHAASLPALSTDTSQVLVASIVQRLVKRLPSNSGGRLSALEEEELIRSSVANLLSHSEYQLAIVVKELLSALEVLNKQLSQLSSDDAVQVVIMQSQLFVLQVLVSCLIHSWKRSIKSDRAEVHPDPAFAGFARGWPDPPALDDLLAKQMLSVMMFYLRVTISREGQIFSIMMDNIKRAALGAEPAKSGRGDDTDSGTDVKPGAEAALLSALSLSNGMGLFVVHPMFPPKRSPFEIDSTRTDRHSDTLPRFHPLASHSITAPSASITMELDAGNSHLLIQSIYRQASQVIFYLSSSNWPVVLARIRYRLAFLSTSAEENPQTTDLHLLECSNVQRAKLGGILQEFCACFLHLKRSAQEAVALVLRRTVRCWIQYHPDEYAQLYASNRRLEGGPDLLFDHVYNLSDTVKRKATFWPMLTSLLILCPDLVSKLAIGDGLKGGSLGKKANFLEAVRKGLRSSKLSDISAYCCVDLCNAATVTLSSESGLRLLVPDLESDLKEKLFTPKSPMMDLKLNIMEVPLMVKVFVAMFRIDKTKTLQEVVPVLMSDSSPIGFKVCLVTGCIQIASEKDRLPSDPDLAMLYSSISAHLRSTFKTIVYKLSSLSKPSGKKLKSRAPEDGTSTRQVLLLQAILQLWDIDIEAACHGMSYHYSTSFSSLTGVSGVVDGEELFRRAMAEDSVVALMHVVTRAAYTTSNWQIHHRASDLMQSCLDATGDDHKDFYRQGRESLISCSSHLTQHIATLLIASTTLSEQQHWLTMLQTVFRRRTDLLDSMGDLANKSYTPSQVETNMERESVKIVMLLMICSASTEVCSLALQTCRQASRLRSKFALTGHLQADYQEWTRLYERLGEADMVQTGRIAQQKRVRACLRQVETCTAPLFAAWKEAYRRWDQLTLLVAQPLREESNDSAQEKAAQWQNFAGCLAALGGACVVDRAPFVEHTGDEAGKRNSRSAEETSLESPVQYVESFVQAMVDLLVSDSIWVREKSKETLGLDLHPRMNGILFRMIHAVLSDFFDKSTGEPRQSEMYTIFVEHSISVMQMVLNRVTSDSIEETSDVDIGALMVLFAEYLNSLTKRDQAARIRASLCQLCEQLMERRNSFTFKNELRVRNRLFQVLAGWTSESIEDAPSTEKSDRLQRDLDIVCLRTISIILDKLPLLLSEDTPLLDDSVEWAKSRQFSACFNYFIKVLNRSKAIEESMPVSDRALPTSSSNLTAALARSRETQSLRDLVPLKQSAILALSNLLASNIATGLHHSLPLAYQEDLQLRTAFMQIMTNVLNQGVAFDDLERLTASQKQSKLVELISEPDLQLALSICNVCRGYDVDKIDYILLNIFDSRGGIIRFLKAALDEEIEQTATDDMVFRSNLFRVHLVSLFGRTHGYEYLRSLMAPLIAEMANKPKGYSFEIDPQRLEPGESAIVNQHRLEEMAQAFIDQICNSAHRVPAVLRELCRHIRQLMDAKFPASRYQGVGGFIFLRFINPAVVAPQNIDINMFGPGKELRRGLLLISKILQTLASNTLFPQHKEPFMTGLNEFLKRNVWKFTNFLDQVSDSRTDPERILAADQPLGFGIQPFGYGIDNDDQAAMHKFIYDNIDKIGKELFSRCATASHDADAASPPPSSAEGKQQPREMNGFHNADGKRIYEQVCMALAELGEPAEPEQIFSGQDHDAQALQDFLRRQSGRNIDNEDYLQIFREGPPSKSGRPVFYFTNWAKNAQTLDYEGFICHIFQVLRADKLQPYDIIFDITGVQQKNLVPQQWLSYFIDLLPPEYAMNVRNVIYFNANTACGLHTRPWASQQHPDRAASTAAVSLSKNSVLHHLQVNANIIYCTSLADLDAYIDRRNIALDSQTLALCASSEEARFSQITMVWYYRALLPVMFKLSESHLQITVLKQQSITKGSSGYFNEVFQLSDIDDVRAISTRGDDNTFYVTCRGGSMSFLFISRDRADIVQSLRQAKARVSQFESKTNRTVDRALLPSDVPGTLLNMAMLNITSQNHRLRLSAYDLLCALSTSFNFGASNAKRRLLSTRGLALSANSISFVADLSRDFATTASGVTLEFLSSFFEGFERATAGQKTACLQYMVPWLPNLVTFVYASREKQRDYQKKVKEIINHLIGITVKHPNLYSTMQSAVWSQFAKLDDLIPTLLDVFCEAAMDSGLHTERFDQVLDTMISFSSINLRGKLLAKLRRVIAKTAQNPTIAQLSENAAWKEIATLIRMNMALSFTSRTESLLYLPELLHVILLLAGNGVDATRHAIHASAINLVHSLSTGDLPREVHLKQVSINGTRGSGAAMAHELDAGITISPESTERLRGLLDHLSGDDSLALFGLSASATSALASAYDASPSVIRETPSNDQIGALASKMYQLVDMAAPSMDTSNAWRARLSSLVTSTAFQYNPIIQSRAFILLGCLGDLTGNMLHKQPNMANQDPEIIFEVDDDLLYQILVSLRGSIQEWATLANDPPIVSIVACLSKVVPILPDKSRYLPQMFWLGVSIIQYGHIPLFKSGLELMIATIKSIRIRRLAERNGADLITFLLEGRFEFREEAVLMDEETGVDFETNFSFALAALVVKGLRHPLTCNASTELLRCMLHDSAFDAQNHSQSINGQISTIQLGFFVALLPSATKAEDFMDLLLLAGVSEEYIIPSQTSGGMTPGSVGRARPLIKERGLYSHVEPMENKEALLVITLLASLLQHSTVSDVEKQQLYRLLADSAERFPAIVSIIYDVLTPNIKEIYLNCQNEDILRSVDTITKAAISEPIFQMQLQETRKRGGAEAYLEESGYASLLDCGSFTRLKDSRRVVLAKLSVALLSGLIDAGTA